MREKIARLKLYGVDEIDMVNGWSTLKEKFLDVARLLKGGDELVVCSLSDVCRKTEELLEVLWVCAKRRFVLRSLDEPWIGEGEVQRVLAMPGMERFMANICRFVPLLAGGLSAEEEAEGTERGKGECVQGGRPKGSIKMSQEKLDLAVRMYCQGDFTVRDICDIVQCNERSMYRYLKLRGVAGLRKMSGGAAGNENRNNNTNGNSNQSVAPEN